MRLKRVAEAFQEVSRARVCDSSGSEHSPGISLEGSTDLFALVNSFLESGNEIGGGDYGEVNEERDKAADDNHLEMKDELMRLLGCKDDDDIFNKNIIGEVEEGLNVVGGRILTDYKRRLMTRLRERGFDSGLCKSKWQKTGQLTSGDYEYIDIQINGSRYVVEVFLAREFEIARPTDHYTSLLDLLPSIFVGKLEELKQVVRLMCKAIKKSMKFRDMHVPPWRRYAYAQAKWFGSYKRTTNEFSIKKCYDIEENPSKKRYVGFVALPATKTSYYCGEDFASKVCSKVGNLAAAINGTNVLL